MGKKIKRSGRRMRSYGRKRIDIDSGTIDFRNVELLKKFVTEKGKILPRRVTGMTARLHRKLTRSIKRARNLLLLK